MREELLKFYMDNPCLSEEIDYCDDEVRLEHYKKQIEEMTDIEVLEALEF